MSNVFVEEASLQDIANAIREKNGTETTYKPSEMGNAIREIESGGSVVDITQLISEVKFSSKGLENYTDDISLNLVNAITIANMFDNKLIKFNKLSIKISSICTSFQNAFRATSVVDSFYKNLKIIEIKGDTIGVTTFINAFNGRTDLEEIQGVLNFSAATNVGSMFNNCSKLREIQMFKNSLLISCDLSSSSLLSNKSIQSIIDGLSDLTGATSQTLSLHADVKAKLTEEQLTTITGKNWTLA